MDILDRKNIVIDTDRKLLHRFTRRPDTTEEQSSTLEDLEVTTHGAQRF